MAPPAVALAGLVPLLALLAGCSAPGLDAPDSLLPGVRTETAIADSFHCGELLFTQGCAILRIDRVESGCAGEVGGYVLCNATVHWSATAGAVEPGSRLTTEANGVVGPSCEPMPGHACRVNGTVAQSARLSGPGDETRVPFALAAVLAPPSGAAQTGGAFALDLDLRFRSDDLGALAS